jgi:hypothetical protein
MLSSHFCDILGEKNGYIYIYIYRGYYFFYFFFGKKICILPRGRCHMLTCGHVSANHAADCGHVDLSHVADCSHVDINPSG